MAGNFEAISDAVTGAMLGRAVEPQAGEAGTGHTHETRCLNCGTPLIGPYCSACGQKAHIHRSVRAFFQDFIQGAFNLEGKMWRTLPMLAWRPGEMTRRYIAGERARFISPVALYLFTVFAMFAVLNFTGTLSPHMTGKHVQAGMKAGIADDQKELAQLELKRKAELAAGRPVAEIDRKIASRKEDIADIENAMTGNFIKADADDETPSWLRPFIENARDNPEMVSMKVQDAASKYSWLLIPMSVPFMWLLFPLRRRYNTYDHIVFVTYSLSFMMLLVITGSLLVAAWAIAIAGEIAGVVLLYEHKFDHGNLGLLIAILVGIAIFAIAGSLMWKAANRQDPARESDRFKFFVQNQLGAIITVIAFLPLLVLIFTSKDMDPKNKKIAGGVGVVVAVIAALIGVSYNPPSVEQYTQDMNKCAAEIKANQPKTDCSPEVAAQAQDIARDSQTVTEATKDPQHPAGQDVVYWIAPENGAKKSATPHVFHICESVSPLRGKMVNHGSVTQAYAENATRITKQIPMEQKQCGFTSSK